MTKPLSVSDAVIILLDDQLKNGILDDQFGLLETQVLRDLANNPLPCLDTLRTNDVQVSDFKNYVKTDPALEPLRERVASLVKPEAPSLCNPEEDTEIGTE